MFKRDHNSQQHDDRDKVASNPPFCWHGMTNTAVSVSTTDTTLFTFAKRYNLIHSHLHLVAQFYS